MIVIDVNLLIYAYDKTCPGHAKAREWLEETFSGNEIIGLPWLSIAAFVRILTYPGLHDEQLNLAQVLAIVEQWIGLPNVRLLAPTERHWSLFREMMEGGEARGKLTTDAELAALTVEHGGVFYTNDRDFARFPGLRWINPLQSSRR